MNHVDLSSVVLTTGKHKSPDEGLCLLELSALFAGESHTDHPVCVSPVLGEFGRRLNDVLPDGMRQRLIPLVPRMVGTANDGLDETRGWLATDWLVRVYAPAWLDAAGLSGEAAALRGLAPVRDMESAVAARPVTVAAKAAARVAARVVGVAARVAARAVGVAAAWDAAAKAAGVVAAWDAAVGAVGAAALASATEAVGAVAAPTVTALQISAIDLLDRMVDCRWTT